uniref:Ig-like domain repeat protein n=1 Tax=Methanobrevibacter sp. TaxID=66852 RepID=UPI003890E314
VTGLTDNVTANVTYRGDNNHNNASTTVDIVVNEEPKKNLTNMVASAEPIHIPEDATVVVTGLDNATGNVAVTIGDNIWSGEITNGTASVVVTGLTDNVTANVTYRGDNNHNNASTTVDIVVNEEPKKNLTNMVASAESIHIPEDATVVVTGLDNATGNVTVTIGDNIWSGEITNGTASVVVTGLTDNVTANVFYAGDYMYNNASTTVNIVVYPQIRVWYVDGNRNSSGNGTSKETAFKTLKEAVNKAPDGSTIYIMPGTYVGDDNVGLFIDQDLSLINYGGGEVIFDAQGLCRILTVNAESINITGLTFKNGKEEYVGGAILFNLALNNSIINATFINNTIMDGAGGAITFYSEINNSVINSVFINNQVIDGDGGVIYFNDDLNNVTIGGTYNNNSAEENGGVFYFYGNLTDVIVSGDYADNVADYGAVYYVDEYSLVNNSSISGNYTNNTAFYGGVIFSEGNITNSNMSGNYTNNNADTGVNYIVNVDNVGISGNYINNNVETVVNYILNADNVGISGNYINNNVETGVNFIFDANNVGISGNYVNNTLVESSVIYMAYSNGSFIHDSIFINNSVGDEPVISALIDSISVVNCWFGNNATNYNVTPNVSQNVALINWLFLNATANPTELNINETSEITFKLYSYNNASEEISEYDASKMNVKLDLNQTSGTLSKDSVLINEPVMYNCTGEGIASVTGKFETASYTIILAKAPTEIIVNKTDITLNVSESVSAGASLIPAEAGNLTYTSSNSSVVIVEDGKIIGIKEGNATITVSFEGNEYYIAAENKTINVTVKLNDASVSVNNATLDLEVNDTFNLIASTSPEDLDVTFTSSNESVATVDADGKILAVGEGSAVITVNVGGDGIYALNSTNVTVTVKNKKENATISIDAPSQATEGDNVTVTVTLPEDATGSVTIGNEIVPVQNGTARAVLTNIPAGNTTVPITYSGDDKYNPIETSVTVTVDEKPVPPKENLTISAAADPITVGENATIVVTGFEDATGNVTVTVNGKTYNVPINEGKAAITVTGLTENTTATISYPGDDKYNNASTTVDIVVNPKPKENATISIDAPSEAIEGDNVTVTVTLPEDATGSVTIGNEIIPVQNGTARAVLTNIPAGNTTVPVTYSGDDKYNSASTTVDIVVNPKPKENATIEIDVPPVTEGQDTTINVELPEDATGNVTAVVDGKTYTAPVKDGKATITIPDLAAGNYTVPVTYSGDDKYNSLTEEVNIAVDEDKSDIILAHDVTKYFSGPERFVVTVTDYQGKPLANKSVTISINGRSYERTTDVNGTASIALGLNSGVYNTTVTVDNKTINSVVTILSTVNGTDIIKVFRNATQYYATFRDGQGNYLKDGETVIFNINGVMYERKVSGDKGLARLNINLNAGEYVVTAMNPVTGDMTSNNITVLSRITENADLVKYYRNASQYTVKVLGDDGKAVGAGESVTFNINGVLYTRQTDANGIAKLNINLQPGDYIITAEYKGCLVSNNIKVLPVLNASDISMKYRDGTQFKASLVDGQGKPYAGQSVTFNINGVLYNRPTGSDGIAKLNINLMPGEYIITSSYNGSSIGNKITIKG